MFPYQPNSDALLPPAFAEATAGRPLALPALPVDPLCSLPLRESESFFASIISSFFSDFAFDFTGFGLCFAAAGGEAFATRGFFGVGLGVVLALDAGVALGWSPGVAVALAFGVAEGSSISLFALFTASFS